METIFVCSVHPNISSPKLGVPTFQKGWPEIVIGFTSHVDVSTLRPSRSSESVILLSEIRGNVDVWNYILYMLYMIYLYHRHVYSGIFGTFWNESIYFDNVSLTRRKR